MTTLSNQIAEYEKEKKKRVPADILETMDSATTELKQSGLEEGAKKTGDKAPDFTLPNHLGKDVALAALLEQGPVVLSFYRGGWCPYCNLELNNLQRVLPEITSLGARLVAVSPETPDNSVSTRQKNELAFDVLYDAGNNMAESYGLVFTLPEKLRPIYQNLGIDIPAYNGDDTFRLPVPATYVIGTDGVIAFHFADADYTKRLEPAKIVEALKKL